MSEAHREKKVSAEWSCPAGYGMALKWGEQYLMQHGIADAPVDAWLLLEYTTGTDRTRFLLDRGLQMTQEEKASYQDLIQKRGTHIPLQHLTGVQEFMGLEFQVNEHVLIPRQDTEILVEEAMKYLKPRMRVLDLCTGSGCIAVSLARLGPGTITVDGADISAEALQVARQNADRLNASVCFIQSDLFEAAYFSGTSGVYDMIVSNPPYIQTSVIDELSEEVRLHEPFGALDGREDGLYFYRKIIYESRAHLKEDGWLLFEIGYDQGEAVSRMMRENGFGSVKVIQDLAGLDRVVCARLEKV